MAAELGAETFHATGADGEPYPAPDVGGSLDTARAVLGLASWLRRWSERPGSCLSAL